MALKNENAQYADQGRNLASATIRPMSIYISDAKLTGVTSCTSNKSVSKNIVL